ncbi:MAG: FtsW/RodA/SpoVE family cell cycle protein, partial [Oscillospiraceae bacterium]
AGEAMGFIGTVGIIIALGILCMVILKNAMASNDFLGRYICVGVFAMIFFQSFWGIGMCLSLLPVAGLPVPLFSAGGTSVVMTYAALGLVLNVHRYSVSGLFSEN